MWSTAAPLTVFKETIMNRQQLGRRASRMAKASLKAEEKGDKRSAAVLARRASILYRRYLVA